MARAGVTQPSRQSSGISDGRLMHGSHDHSIRAHGQSTDGNRSRECPGKPCGDKSALNGDGRCGCSTPSQICGRGGRDRHLRRRKSSRLLRQFAGTSHKNHRRGTEGLHLLGTIRGNSA